MSDGSWDRTKGWIARARVIPILRLRNHVRMLDVAKALRDAGLDLMEVTLDHPRAPDSLEKLANALGSSVLLGAGTVRVAEQVKVAKEAGAQFIVSPGMNADVMTAAHEQEVLPLPGVLTPTEIEQALKCGADLLKLFPAVGLGPSYLSALRGPYPTLSFVPTGGITLATVRNWLDAGATAVGLGGDLASDHLSIGEISDRARNLVVEVGKVETATEPIHLQEGARAEL